MTQSKRCPKCDGSMARGFIVDTGYGTTTVASWAPGEPQKSIWTGLKLTRGEKVEIQTWRCGRCFYLESYAPGG